MTGKLDDKEYLFAMLAALVKREGGELRISEEEISKLQTSDVIALLYDTKTGEVVLRVGDYQKSLKTWSFLLCFLIIKQMILTKTKRTAF